MSTTKTVVGATPYPSCESEIRVTSGEREPMSPVAGLVTLVVQSGAAYLQTYATRAELADLILALQLARDELDEQLTPTQLVTDWAAA